MVLKCQGTQINETGFVGITYLYGHILASVCAYFSMDTFVSICTLIRRSKCVVFNVHTECFPVTRCLLILQ